MGAASPKERGAFEALCDLAASERWCWKMFCTTCGHMHFRYALHELARGRHPAKADWLVTKLRLPETMRGWPKDLGSLPPFSGWPLATQRALAERLAPADLGAIASRCPFPDWLGYLGLGLHYCEDAEGETKQLTSAWAPQLIALLPGHTNAVGPLAAMLQPDGPVLTWRALESVEGAIQQQPRAPH